MSNSKAIKELAVLARTVESVAERLTILQRELGGTPLVLPASGSRRKLRGERKDKYAESLKGEKNL